MIDETAPGKQMCLQNSDVFAHISVLSLGLFSEPGDPSFGCFAGHDEDT